MKLLFLYVLVMSPFLYAETKVTSMMCQAEMCGPDSHIQVDFTSDYTNFTIYRGMLANPFTWPFQSLGILKDNQEFEKLHFSFHKKDCLFSARGISDFSCSGTILYGHALIRTYKDINSSDSIYKITHIDSALSSPWKIDIKSMASSYPTPFNEYNWNVRVTHEFKSFETEINIGQCTY